MSSVFSCIAYENIKGNIRMDRAENPVIFLEISSPSQNDDFHLTLSPAQAKDLGKFLYNTAASLTLDELSHCSPYVGSIECSLMDTDEDVADEKESETETNTGVLGYALASDDSTDNLNAATA